MPGLKRKSNTASGSAGKGAPDVAASAKKARAHAAAPPAAAIPTTALVDSSQIDFPRGGGSGLTAFEHASTLREARAEMSRQKRGDDDLFKDPSASAPSSSKETLSAGGDAASKEERRKFNRDRQNAKKKKKQAFGKAAEEVTSKGKQQKDHIRIEHLNYKRLAPGTRLLCSVAAVHPLALVLSLPNHLVGHVPIASISPLFTQKLHEAAEADSDEEMDGDESEDGGDDDASTNLKASNNAQTKLASGLPELRDCFNVGQWVRAAVVAVNAPGVTRGVAPGSDAHEFDKESRRVELTLAPEALNEGISPEDLATGYVLPVSIKSKEDHGFLLDTGLDEIQGFAPYDKIDKDSVYLGQVLDAAVVSVASQGRSFTASLIPSEVQAASLGPQDAPSSSALLPGCQVTALITAALSTGLNAKLWGMFDATLDSFHLPAPLPTGKEMHEVYKVGSKIKARILWESQKSEMGTLVGNQLGGQDAGPRAVALSAAPHVLSLSRPLAIEGKLLQEAYPIGSKVEAKVVHTDSEWGLTCSVTDASVQGFTHISRVSDEHVVKLFPRSGPFAVGTIHQARVVGHAPTDRLLLLSFQQSVLDKSFMRVSEIEVGAVLRATVSKIGTNGSGIFLDLGGAFEGIVFPLHFADVPLKKPEKKYKPGATVKARVLNVDPARNRISLTLKKSLVTSDLPIVASIQDARVGVVTQGTVSKFVDNRGIIVDLFGGLRAFVPASEATETPLNPSTPSLQSHFYEGKVVKMRLTHVDYEEHKLLASVKQASPSYLAKLDVAAVQVGEKVSATVAAVHQDVVVLELQPSKVRGLLALNIVAAQRKADKETVREQLQDGETLSDLVVVDKHTERGIVIVGDANAPLRKVPAGLSDPLSPGSTQTGRVSASSGEPNVVTVFLAGGCRGRLHLTDVTDDFAEASLPKNNEQIQVHLLRLRNSGKRADVLLRPSRLTSEAANGDLKDPEVDRASDLTVGEKRRGFVKAISTAGLFVDLGRNVTARVLISELFDHYVKEWQGRFKIGQLVSGTITALDISHSKVEMSLKTTPGSSKKSKADRAAERKAAAEAEKEKRKAAQLKFSDLTKGMKINGFVRAVQDYGVFVQIENTQISGLAHKSQLTNNTSTSSDPTKAFKVGDRVKAIVLDVQPEKKKVGFGLKPSYFTEEDFEESDDDGEEEGTDSDEDMDGADDEEGGSDVEMDASALLASDDDDSSDGDVLDLEADEDDSDSGSEDEASAAVAPPSSSAKTPASAAASKESGAASPVPALELAGGFSWSLPEDGEAAASDSEAEDSDSDSEDSDSGSRKRLQKKAPKAKRGKNRDIEDDLTADLANKAPESSADFERMLLGSPNSSYLWIQFMSFQLQLSEVDQAREVARRALKVINYREEREKLNVWIALLNLENTYGTDETLEATFREAAQMNDGKTVHLRMASIFEQTGKVDKAAEMWKRTAKKFGHSSKVWVGYEQFYLRVGRTDEARALLPRSLQSLEKRKHVKTISAFGLAEFKLGDPERARTIFEGLVDTYPKRLDLWWQYIDQEAVLRNVQGARLLFERVLNLKQSTKKAKSILKKWLDFEKRHGDAKGEQAVLLRARQFVEELNAKKQQSQAAQDGEDDDDDMDDEDEEED